MRANTEEELGSLIWHTSRADEGTISVTGANIVANAILESGWLVKHDAQVRREALKEAAEVFQARLPDRTGNGRAYNSYKVARMLLDMSAVSSVEGDAKLSGNSVVGEDD